MLTILLSFIPFLLAAQPPAAVRITVNAGAPVSAWRPLWNGFGYDELNTTTTAHGRRLLRELAALTPAPVYIRAHNLFTSGRASVRLKWGASGVYSEDAQGRPVYHWAILDAIFDAYRQAGVVPDVELGFMPKALSTHPHPYAHHFPVGPLFTGWSYPPQSYRRWGGLVYAVARHLRRRYGSAAVRRWRWEVWNEPDIPYWHGTAEEYFRLYDTSAAALHRAIPGAVIGGPETTGPRAPRAAAFLRAFLQHCARGRNAATGGRGAPLDFISFHPKGDARMEHGRQRMGLAAQLQSIDAGFRIVAASRAFHRTPIVLGENDPEGCAACSPRRDPGVDYRNGTVYPAYNAAVIKAIAGLERRDRVRCETAVTWAFEFEGLPYFSGLRQLATNGIDLPVLNGFRMFGRLGSQRLRLRSSGAIPLVQLLRQGVPPGEDDVDGIATRRRREVEVLLWNYADQRPAAKSGSQEIELRIAGLPAHGRLRVAQFRIDHRHSNAYTVWLAMGRPAAPNPAQLRALQRASRLARLQAPARRPAPGGTLALRFRLPCPGLSLLRIRW